jgi:hypothetical protein
MKTLALIAVVLANLLLLSLAVFTALAPQVHDVGRIAAAVAAACTLAVVALLLVARSTRLPAAAARAAPLLCAGTVVAWVAGSVGPGGADTRVIAFLVLVAIVAVAGWLVFRRLRPPIENTTP